MISKSLFHTFIQRQDCLLKSNQSNVKDQETRHISPFLNKPWFVCVCSTSLLKTMWEKEKLLVMSNFSFSHSVFYPFEELFVIYMKLKIVFCKLLLANSPNTRLENFLPLSVSLKLSSANTLSLEKSKIGHLGKG